MARKPVEKTIVDNVLKYGCGGINIDECRVLVENTKDFATNSLDKQQKDYKPLEKCNLEDDNFRSSENDKNPLGRFPANVIIDGSEEVLSGFPYTKSSDMSLKEATPFTYNKDAFSYGHKTRFYNRTYNDSGSAGRYFYCAKASKKDRNEGLDVFKDALTSQDDNNTLEEGVSNVSLNNFHPTVKPTSLMQYLVRLVTPKGGTVLDVFMGSGSTGKATMYENIERDANYKFIGIELTKEYLPLCKARIEFVTKENIDLTEETIEENNDKNSNVPKIISLW